MKHLTFLIDDKKKYKNAQKESQKSKYNTQLIQVFSGELKLKKIEKLLKKLKNDFPQAIIIGATSAGEISHAKVFEHKVVVSLSLFKHTKLQVHYEKQITKKAGVATAKSLCLKDTKAIVVLSEGLSGEDYEAYLSGLKSAAPDVLIAGGLAGDNFKLEKTYVFKDTQIYKEGSVAVSFSSPKLYASNRYNLNWTPIGMEFEITKVNGNKVEEIASIPAVDFFEKYLGKEIVQNAQLLLPNFQLLFKESDTIVARTPLQIEGKSLVFAAPVKENQVVQFGFSSESSVVDNAYKIRNELVKKPAEGIYVFSCIARKTLLGETLTKELQSFEEVAPSAGFFTYGEFYSAKKKDVLLNCTTTLLILSESKKLKQLNKHEDVPKTLDTITFDALSHFIKQTSLELRHNVKLMNQYKNVVDASALVSKTDRDGFITYVNENFCRVSQYTPQELIGRNHNIVRDPHVSSFIFKKMWQTIHSGKVWKGTFSNRAKDGSIYYVDATIMPIFDDNGDIEEYIAIRQDITKQKQANKRVSEKEKLIRAIFDNQDGIVIHASKTYGMQGINKKFFEYFDFKSLEDFKTKHKCICDLFIEEEGYVSVKNMPDWLEKIANDENTDYKVKMKTKDGIVRTYTLKVKPIGDEYIINLYDITTLEQALFKAYSSEQAKATFLANMSHEIRTPLNGILGFTDLLVKKDLDKDTKRYIDIIHKSGQTLLNVVNDILDFSKIESGELSLYEAPSRFVEEMEATVATFSSVARDKKINYYSYIDTNIPVELKCDIQRVKQVVNNLISNALKFTPEDGEVTVKIELLEIQNTQAKIHFSVKDSGIGIPKEKLATIFQAFSQADNSISREFGGTGLGLAISNQYINMMGSQIEVQSSEGEGSEFYFDLSFEIVNADAAVSKNFHNETLKLAVLNSHEGIACGINQIVYTYLNAWQCSYDEIDDIEEIDDTLDILIVCAKLFDRQRCEATLERYPQLKLIYIEGSDGIIGCNHERFYLLEQPMTGSALFDKIVTLADSDKRSQLHTAVDLPQSQQNYYSGKVLVAEDNETNQMLISIMLDERKVAYKIVENGRLAVDEALSDGGYDLIFMDINMPVLDGIGAIKELRLKNYTAPIVSLSANVIESDTKKFREAGVDDVLNKPIIPQELDRVLHKYLKQEASKQESLKQDTEVAFDTINVELVAKELSVLNHDVIKKLFKSLASSFKEIIELMNEGRFDADLMHKLKGASGNMRLHNLYTLAGDLEKSLESFDEEQKIEKMGLVMAHLQNALEQIEAL
jgi:PAS domain S-box-containing protein